MNRFLAVLRKEFRQVRRDPLSLTLLIFVPAVLLVLYGYALSFDVKNIRTAVLDLDRTPASRSLLDSVFQNPYFTRTGDLERYHDANGVLDRGDAQIVLVIPRGYASEIDRDGEAKVQALVDGSDSTVGTIAIGYLDALAQRKTAEIVASVMERSGRRVTIPAVVPTPRIWFNPELESVRFLIPGLIGMLLMLSAVIATSLSIVREKENQTIEQMRVSPLRPLELILGKTVPYMMICVATTALILVLGYVLFNVAVAGSFLLLALAVLIFMAAALGMGVLISSITSSQQVAYQIATLTSMLPSILLSGFIFPIKNMPPPVQAVTYLVAPRYFISALRKIVVKGAPMSALWSDLLPLLGLALLFNFLAARNVRKVV
ncbi:MAG: ABC transporter permease [Candidatus Eisenbacteria bacterium]|nr:ABC transporter permease [Candidatus Eisenbacteria bacterium]